MNCYLKTCTLKKIIKKNILNLYNFKYLKFIAQQKYPLLQVQQLSFSSSSRLFSLNMAQIKRGIHIGETITTQYKSAAIKARYTKRGVRGKRARNDQESISYL